MGEFNPDEWLAKKQEARHGAGFDPDAWLAKRGDKGAAIRSAADAVGGIASDIGGKAKAAIGDFVSDNKSAIKGGLIRTATGAIPVVTGAGGGALGFLAGGPLPAVAGGGLGYAAGKNLEEIANHYLVGDPFSNNSVLDMAAQTGGNIAKGGAATAMGLAGGTPLGQAVISRTAPVVGYAGRAASAMGRRAGKAAGGLAKTAVGAGLGLAGLDLLKKKFGEK